MIHGWTVCGGSLLGWTGSGRPKAAPVAMLNRPEKTSVLGREMDPWRARAIMRGRRVPRSPRAPEISERGAWRTVRRLCLVNLGMSLRAILDGAGEGSRCLLK